MTRLLFFVLYTAISGQSVAQYETETTTSNSWQYGLSLKTTAELHKKRLLFRLAGAIGIGTFVSPYLFPSSNLEVQFYYGGFGTRAYFQKGWQPTLDITGAFTLTGSFSKRLNFASLKEQKYRNTPLFYFADFAQPPLQNPFSHSISIGKNFTFSSNCSERRFIQTIGFLNVHIQKFQFSYYNDGGYVINQLRLGDGQDRGYTGGVVLSYHLPSNRRVSQFQFAFHKYTGYSPNAFELANDLSLTIVDYKEKKQQLYNKSYWSFNVASIRENKALFFKRYNQAERDFQHWIHYLFFYSYHLSPEPPSSGYGVESIFNHTKIFTK